MPHVLLETERLQLVQFQPGDESKLFELDADPEVMRFINGGHPTPAQQIRDEILPLFCCYRADHPVLGFWAAQARATGAFLGWFSLRPDGTDDPTNVTLGYRLRRTAWGQGLATEGARALMDMGFEVGGVTRIRATTYEKNLGSLGVMKKLGMRLERRFRLGAEDLGSDTASMDLAESWPGFDHEYLITRDQWAD